MAAKTVIVEKNVYAIGFAKLNRKSSTETMKVARNQDCLVDALTFV